MPHGIAVLVISDVSKSFPVGEGVFLALDRVTLKVQAGEFVSIMGHSGCGKSTLLNIVAGLDGATEGGVIVNGREQREPGPDRMVVFQNYSLLPWMTVLENVLLAVHEARSPATGERIFGGRPRAWREARAREYLELVNLGDAHEKYPNELSGGMKQRVSIARGLVVEPQILILDEPFGALDAITREEMQDELLSIWEGTETTGLMVTHEIDEAILLSDRIALMTNGPGAKIGEVLDIPFARPRTRQRIMEDPRYYKLRNHVLRFLHERFAHDEGGEVPTARAG